MFNTIKKTSSLLLLTFCLAYISACSEDGKPSVDSIQQQASNKIMQQPVQKTNSIVNDNLVVWAVNVGGDAYLGADGIAYQADTLSMPAKIGNIQIIKGAQDSTIYYTYREGDILLSHRIDNGMYDIVFKFAEPEDIASGNRIFNVFAQGKNVIDTLDVRQARDGKHQSALDRAVSNVEVIDGTLNIHFEAIKGSPILSAIVVSKKHVADDNWQLVWNDEFTQDGPPDTTKWNYDLWPAKKVNDEDQTYTSRAKNVRVENGKLILEAHKEQYNGAEYTSARLNARGKGDFLYGRAEISAKIPAGRGTWAAIWMLPSDPFKYSTSCTENDDWQGSSTCDAWPNSGEIDIMEHVGFDMQNVHGTVHNKAYYWANWQQRKSSIEAQTADQQFHRYAMEWTPETITIFFDNTPYFFYSNEGAGWEAWPFDHPYHLILNLAIGGMWGRAGGPIDDSIFPVKMEVDYVRIYQQNN
ncbi:family 16 glycosylhydrolase [Colwelliaceae bacterium BS250]